MRIVVALGGNALLKRGETKMLPVSFNEIATEVLHLTHADLIGRGVMVSRSFAPKLPLVAGDRVQLQQVLLNLLMNAFDASELPGATTRRVILRAEADGDSMVHVSVRDHGPGLPPEGSEIWFEPFHTSKPNGLGMGLVIVRGIIEAHGGTLQVDAAEGGGACFHFRLPAAKEDTA